MVNRDKLKNIFNSNLFANIISLLAFGISLVVLYRTEFARGKVDVFSPSRIAVASAQSIKLQGNESDKIILSFSIYNNGTTLKTIKRTTLTLIDKNQEEKIFFADAQLDKIRDIQIDKSPLQENENYSLVTAISIPPKSHYIATQIFFYGCDRGWRSGGKNQFLNEYDVQIFNCKGKPDSFTLKPKFEYQARIRVDAFGEKSKDSCFSFILPNEIEATVFDFSPVHKQVPCS